MNVSPTIDNTYYYQISNQFLQEMILIFNSDKLSFVTGLELSHSLVQGDYNTHASKNPSEQTEVSDGVAVKVNHYKYVDFGIYGQSSYRVNNKLNLSLGLRFDNKREQETQGDGSIFNYRLASVYQEGDFIFKGILATAEKNLTNLEKYSTGSNRTPNESLEPEKVTNKEFSISYGNPSHIFFTGAYYHANYSGAIREVYVDSKLKNTQNRDMGSLIIQGFQFSSSYRIQNFNSYLNYTYTNPNYEDIKELPMTEIAEHQVNFGFTYNILKNLKLHIRGQYDSKRYSQEINLTDEQKLGLSTYKNNEFLRKLYKLMDENNLFKSSPANLIFHSAISYRFNKYSE
jgi:outer membrane receptor for ferrienterochelin and colicin